MGKIKKGETREKERSYQDTNDHTIYFSFPWKISRLLLESSNEFEFGICVYLKGIRHNMCRHGSIQRQRNPEIASPLELVVYEISRIHINLSVLTHIEIFIDIYRYLGKT